MEHPVGESTVNRYFSDLVFTRVEKKSTGDQEFFVYVAALAGRFEDGRSRYVLLMVPSHLAILAKGKISDLSWDNLQTRRLSLPYRLPKQSWIPPRNLPDVLLEVNERKTEYSMYRAREFATFPFDVLLLHNPMKRTKYQFNNRLMLSACLDTFSCSIVYRGWGLGNPLDSPDGSFEVIPQAI